MRKFTLVLGLVGLAAIPASGQIANTGVNASGGKDNSWTVTATPTFGSSSYAGNAFISTLIPYEWQANNATARWIAAWDVNGVPNAPDGAGDNAHRYNYDFSTNFTLVSPSTVTVLLGWDNILRGITIGGSAYTFGGAGSLDLFSHIVLPPDNHPADTGFGFCRSSDGTFYGGEANCSVGFSFDVASTSPTALDVLTWGDGGTDGIRAELSVQPASATTAVTPEPATMSLLATGLVSMAGLGLRQQQRRRRQS